MSIVVEKISKSFTGQALPAVASVSFSAKQGAITSLLGPSGSGKSTLLRLIAGLETADSGRILLADKDLTGVPPQKRNVGVVFQSYALFRNMNVRDNIAFGLSVRKASREEQDARVRELLELVGLQGYGARFPDQLSGGQRQRVALARALAPRPEVLLLDEPFGALDTQVRSGLRRFLRELHEKTHVTTLLVTHDQEEALELSEHVVLLDQGRVAQAGDPHELYDHPASSFVASFLGQANLLALNGGGEPPSPDSASLGGQIFLRPHDVRIRPLRTRTEDVPGADTAEVVDLLRVGGNLRLWLSLANGQSLRAELPYHHEPARDLRRGDRVVVDLSAARTFGGGAGI